MVQRCGVKQQSQSNVVISELSKLWLEEITGGRSQNLKNGKASSERKIRNLMQMVSDL
jgi:hypothetical protein